MQLVVLQSVPEGAMFANYVVLRLPRVGGSEKPNWSEAL